MRIVHIVVFLNPRITFFQQNSAPGKGSCVEKHNGHVLWHNTIIVSLLSMGEDG
jgi:hypothetical protein